MKIISLTKFYVVLFLLLNIIVLFSESARAEERWKFISSDNNIAISIDTKTITYPSKNTIRVWEKWNYSNEELLITKKALKKSLKNTGRDYEKYSHSMLLIEYNCLENSFRLLKISDYDTDGILLDSMNAQIYKEFGWEAIPPDSRAKRTKDILCGEFKQK